MVKGWRAARFRDRLGRQDCAACSAVQQQRDLGLDFRVKMSTSEIGCFKEETLGSSLW